MISRQTPPVMRHDLLVAVRVDFDIESVGNGGAGFAWPHPNALGEQPLHMLQQTPGFNTSDTDEESVPDRDHDCAEPIDHEVNRLMLVCYTAIMLACHDHPGFRQLALEHASTCVDMNHVDFRHKVQPMLHFTNSLLCMLLHVLNPM